MIDKGEYGRGETPVVRNIDPVGFISEKVGFRRGEFWMLTGKGGSHSRPSVVRLKMSRIDEESDGGHLSTRYLPKILPRMTRILIGEYNACFGYTHRREIILVWKQGIDPSICDVGEYASDIANTSNTLFERELVNCSTVNSMEHQPGGGEYFSVNLFNVRTLQCVYKMLLQCESDSVGCAAKVSNSDGGNDTLACGDTHGKTDEDVRYVSEQLHLYMTRGLYFIRFPAISASGTSRIGVFGGVVAYKRILAVGVNINPMDTYDELPEELTAGNLERSSDETEKITQRLRKRGRIYVKG